MTENMRMEQPQMDTNKKSNLLAILGIVAVVAIVAFVMMQASPKDPVLPAGEQPAVTDQEMDLEKESLKMEEASEATEDELMMEEKSVVTVEVEAGGFYFSPDTITVKKGQTVKIVLNSKDMTHDFVIDELDVRTPVTAGGKSATIEFVASKAGQFEYYCSVGSHRQLGMVGTLIVEE